MVEPVKIVESTITQREYWSVVAGDDEYLCNDRAHAIGEIQRLARYHGPDEISVYRTTELITRSKLDRSEWLREP